MTSSFGGQFSFESTALDTSQVFTLELLLMKCPSLSPSRLQSLKYDSRASLTINHNDRCLHHSKLRDREGVSPVVVPRVGQDGALLALLGRDEGSGVLAGWSPET